MDVKHTTEPDSRFPSGRWWGQYVQFGIRTKQEMNLVFSDGLVEGGGADPVGWFAVTGTYDVETGRVKLRKAYPGLHSVYYDGTAELQHGIWGLWQIPGDDRGGFQLWPTGFGQGATTDAAVEEDLPVGVAEPRSSPKAHKK